MEWKNYLIFGLVLLLSSSLVFAADVIVKNGEFNVAQDFFVDTNTLFIDSSNNRVGIGTASPSDLLDVNSLLLVTSAGNVGIGTTSPINTLNIKGSGAGSSTHFHDSTTGVLVSDGFSVGITGGATDNAQLVQYENAGIEFYTSGTSNVDMFIDSSGNVGIGTTSPNATLYVTAGSTTLADAWSVRSGRDIKDDITELNVETFDFSTPKLYSYKIKYDEFDPETNQTVQKTTEQKIGLMQDEVPSECAEDNGGVDTYCLLALVYRKIAQLENRIAVLEAA